MNFDGELPVPKPTNEYDLLISKGMEAFPERKANYERYLAFKEALADNRWDGRGITHLPVHMDLELASACNLKCDMCYLSLRQEKSVERLSKATIERLLDENPGLIDVRIQGISEPFMQGDLLIDIVSILRERLIWTRTNTNGTLLHRKEHIPRIIQAGIGEIGVSIDGAHRESYERIRSGANFERVVTNATELNRYCRSQGVPKSRMWVVVQRDNIHEIMDFPRFSADMGFERLSFSLSVVDWGIDEMAEKNRQKKCTLSRDQAEELVSRGREHGVEVSFWNHGEKYSSASPCNWVGERCFISSNGCVVPCCVLPNPNIVNFGDIHSQSFHDIWFGEGYGRFRENHWRNAVPAECRSCYQVR